jgi:hypothetical protein
VGVFLFKWFPVLKRQNMKKYLIALVLLLGIAACGQNPNPPVKTTMDPTNAEATTVAFLATRQAKTAIPTVTMEILPFVTLMDVQGADILIWENAGETSGQALTRIPDQTRVELLDVIVVGDGNIWCQIAFNGITGWVSADYVEEIDP